MQERLFRKVALDRLSSPDQLDAMMQITQPRGWLILLTIGAILLGLGLWSVLARIPTTIEGAGVLVADDTALSATLYLPIDRVQRIQTGMQVRLAPATVSYTEYGYLRGVITHIEQTPSRAALARQLSPQSAALAVQVTLIADENTPSGYAWTLGAGPDLHLIPETVVSAAIVVDEKAPLELVFAR